MIRFAKHNGTDYIIIDSSFEVNGLTSPLHIQINLKGVSDEDKVVLYRASSIAFNRHINITKPKQPELKKSWWKFW